MACGAGGVAGHVHVRRAAGGGAQGRGLKHHQDDHVLHHRHRQQHSRSTTRAERHEKPLRVEATRTAPDYDAP
jgi:hypothetical protein